MQRNFLAQMPSAKSVRMTGWETTRRKGGHTGAEKVSQCDIFDRVQH